MCFSDFNLFETFGNFKYTDPAHPVGNFCMQLKFCASVLCGVSDQHLMFQSGTEKCVVELEGKEIRCIKILKGSSCVRGIILIGVPSSRCWRHLQSNRCR